MILQHWGARAEEISDDVAGDSLCPDARLVATRCISIDAAPEVVFAFIRQMGLGRAGWYSYDLIDNLARKSATTIHPEWQDVTAGSTVPAGPVSFVAAVVEPPRVFVLQVPTSRMCFTLAYEARAEGTGTRLVTRLRARLSFPGGRIIEHLLLGPGDGIMVRRQLLNLKMRCEAGTVA
jgi:hypothetical protein